MKRDKLIASGLANRSIGEDRADYKIRIDKIIDLCQPQWVSIEQYEDIKERVYQFQSLSLPGQPIGMHMGTSRLVSELWNIVKSLPQPPEKHRDTE